MQRSQSSPHSFELSTLPALSLPSIAEHYSRLVHVVSEDSIEYRKRLFGAKLKFASVRCAVSEPSSQGYPSVELRHLPVASQTFLLPFWDVFVAPAYQAATSISVLLRRKLKVPSVSSSFRCWLFDFFRCCSWNWVVLLGSCCRP